MVQHVFQNIVASVTDVQHANGATYPPNDDIKCHVRMNNMLSRDICSLSLQDHLRKYGGSFCANPYGPDRLGVYDRWLHLGVWAVKWLIIDVILVAGCV